MHDPDTTVWLRVLDGDQTAWKTLVRRYQPLVYTIATRSGLSMADAADCFQQTFISLFENRKRIEDPSRLSAWIATTAKRESLRSLRSRRNTSDIADHNEIPDQSILPDQELENIQQQAALENGLKQLQERCRKLLTTLFFSPRELSYKELADSIGISANSLGPIRQRCLDRLRQILEMNDLETVRKRPRPSL